MRTWREATAGREWRNRAFCFSENSEPEDEKRVSESAKGKSKEVKTQEEEEEEEIKMLRFHTWAPILRFAFNGFKEPAAYSKMKN